MDHEEFENTPDLNKVAYEVALESIAKMYSDLRSKGMGRRDAAAIVSYILKSDGDIEEDTDAKS